MKIDLKKFQETLPYASELFGIYQPLLGWKSRRIRQRFFFGLRNSEVQLLDSLASRFYPDTHMIISDFNRDDVIFEIEKLNMGMLRQPNRPVIPTLLRSFVVEIIAKHIAENNMDPADTKIWRKLVSHEALQDILHDVRTLLQTNHQQIVNEELTAQEVAAGFSYDQQRERVTSILTNRLNKESITAGILNYLYENKKFELLKQLFFSEERTIDLSALDQMQEFIDPMENFNPKADIGLVSLSPVGIVHLFRQYFFEFDTFLGPSVQHIWLSPGASLELIEIHTRRQISERLIESSLETIVKTEKSSTQQDELSEAVKNENQNDTKLGISVSAGGTISGGVPGLYAATGHVDTTTSYGLESNEKVAKEVTHKQMRQQSDKLSTEIKQNFKTTFKTVTEIQDTSSKRYVLQNNTPQLVNYELRRKMRHVGVQVQDIGTQLCWQTYVDLPGGDLGIANLVHIAEPPDMAALPHPQQGAIPQPSQKTSQRNYFSSTGLGTTTPTICTSNALRFRTKVGRSPMEAAETKFTSTTTTTKRKRCRAMSSSKSSTTAVSKAKGSNQNFLIFH